MTKYVKWGMIPLGGDIYLLHKKTKQKYKSKQVETSIPKTLPYKEVVAAIERAFQNRTGRLQCRFLYVCDGIFRYRVNWFKGVIGDEYIAYSSFVLIRQSPDGLIVEDRSHGTETVECN